MPREDVRSILQAILVAVSLYLIHVGYVEIGYGLLIFFAVMLLQSAFTKVCPLDFVLKMFGLKSDRDR